MDTMRSPYAESRNTSAYDEDEVGGDILPVTPGRDERRMQVHAYNHWASLLGSREFPSIGQLKLDALPDFAPSAVLIEFTGPDEAPHLAHIGKRLADQAGIDAAPRALKAVPGGTLLSRFIEHYAQIFANRAPIGFEAEFDTPQGTTMLYRGILLPFSDDPDSSHCAQISQILGVINWKERLDAKSSEKLMDEMRDAMAAAPAAGTLARPVPPPGARSRLETAELADQPWRRQGWADGPGGRDPAAQPAPTRHPLWPQGEEGFAQPADPSFWPSTPGAPGRSLDGLLQIARQLVDGARLSPARDHHALYAAIGAAHDLALAGAEAPERLAALLATEGLAPQPRVPDLPVVKLVFGAAHDKTRLTEYASVLAHARRLGLGKGALPSYLTATQGGLKAVIAAERAHRRTTTSPARRAPLPEAEALDRMQARDWADLVIEEDASLVLVRRREGRIEPLGTLTPPQASLSRLLRPLLGQDASKN
jgi:hypothetical protein